MELSSQKAQLSDSLTDRYTSIIFFFAHYQTSYLIFSGAYTQNKDHLKEQVHLCNGYMNFENDYNQH